jgi:hypothetical protein
MFPNKVIAMDEIYILYQEQSSFVQDTPQVALVPLLYNVEIIPDNERRERGHGALRNNSVN